MGAMVRTERRLDCKPDCWSRTNVELEGINDKRAWIVWLLVWSIENGNGQARLRLLPTVPETDLDFAMQKSLTDRLEEIQRRSSGIKNVSISSDGEIYIRFDIMDVLGEDAKETYLKFFEAAIKFAKIICEILGVDPEWFKKNISFETREAVCYNGEWVTAEAYLRHKFHF